MIFFRQRINLFYLITGIILNVFLWLLAWQQYLFVQSFILVLKNNIYFGESWVSRKSTIFFLPAIGAIFLMINLSLALAFNKKNGLIASMLVVGAFAQNLLLVIAMLFIIFVWN